MRYCTCGHDVSLHERVAGIIDPCIVDGCDCDDFSDTPRKSVREILVERRGLVENDRVPHLPEPDRIIRHVNGKTFPVWDTDSGAVIVEGVPGSEISMMDGDYLLHITEARKLARVLDAAADEAERRAR